jgi:hypothetical protein
MSNRPVQTIFDWWMGITLSFGVLVLIGIADNEFSGATEVIVLVAGSDLVARAARPLGCQLRAGGTVADRDGPRLRSLVDERDAGRLRRVH